jgi:hypothetical protein
MTEDQLRQRVLLLCLGLPRIAAAVLAWVQKAPEGALRDRRLVALESCAARSLRTDGSAACLIDAAEKAEAFLSTEEPVHAGVMPQGGAGRIKNRSGSIA